MKSDPPDDDREVLNVEDWAEIRRLHRAEGMPIRAISRQLGVGRNTVRRALAADGPPKYRRPVKGSAVEPQIRALLKYWPAMPAPGIGNASDGGLTGYGRCVRDPGGRSDALTMIFPFRSVTV